MGLTKEQELPILVSHIATIFGKDPPAKGTEHPRVRVRQSLADFRPVSLDFIE